MERCLPLHPVRVVRRSLFTGAGVLSESGARRKSVEDSVQAEPRIDDGSPASGREPDIPEWAYDDLATRLVLYLQYPPEDFRTLYRLVKKHWRDKEPMRGRRKDMERLRKKGELVFAKRSDGRWYAREDVSSSYPAFDGVRRVYLKTLKSTGHLLSYSSWKFLNEKRPKRNKMKLAEIDRERITKDLDATLEKALRSPRNFPFMSGLANPPLTSVLSNWRSLLSPGYLFYVIRMSVGPSMADPALRPVGLLVLTTIIFIPIYKLCTHFAEYRFPNSQLLRLVDPHPISLLLQLLQHKPLPSIRFRELLEAPLAYSIVMIAWACCTWAAMVVYSLSAKPLETDPTLRQKLQSWFRPFLSRS